MEKGLIAKPRNAAHGFLLLWYVETPSRPDIFPVKADHPKQHARQRSDVLRSHFWLATVQEVLQADWQDVWHSPHPAFFRSLFNAELLSVLMCFIQTSIAGRSCRHCLL
jgi:hypothetical protein